MFKFFNNKKELKEDIKDLKAEIKNLREEVYDTKKRINNLILELRNPDGFFEKVNQIDIYYNKVTWGDLKYTYIKDGEIFTVYLNHFDRYKVAKDKDNIYIQTSVDVPCINHVMETYIIKIGTSNIIKINSNVYNFKDILWSIID